MNCKFCNEVLPEKGYFCPVCGRDQREELVEELELEIEAEVEQEDWENELTADEDVEENFEEEFFEKEAPLQKSKRIAAITGCIAVLAILATVLFMGIRGGWDVKSWFDWQLFRENTITYKENYTVDDKTAGKKNDVVIAQLGDAELTNGQLQIYYWSEVYNFVSNYYYYLSYLGLDYTKPLDEQMYMENQTWQQYFLETALQTWQANQALCAQAKANGYELPADIRQELDNMATTLEQDALTNQYESATAMVQESFGAGCTVEDYITYMEVYYYAYSYFAEEYEKINPTMEQIEAYFNANEATLASQGISKEDGNYVDVRHILMKIDNFVIEDAEDQTEAQTEGEEGTTTEEEKYSEEEWAACLAEAQRILDLWLQNPTEEYFAELANTYSDDKNGEVTDGGIYTKISKETSFVAPFLNWCMDESRQVGDYDIVRTDYGYHIMYLSACEPTWIADTRDAILSEESQKMVNQALEAAKPEIDYKKIVLGAVEF